MRVVLLLVGLALLAGCGGSAAAPGSGIRGQALVGTCAAEQPGMDCTAPLQTEFEVRRAGQLVETVNTDQDGRFTVHLEPGTYVLTSDGNHFPYLKPVRVTVRRNAFATATLGFDSGIR
jgi:hypothetical protein